MGQGVRNVKIRFNMRMNQRKQRIEVETGDEHVRTGKHDAQGAGDTPYNIALTTSTCTCKTGGRNIPQGNITRNTRNNILHY
eukprot:9068813-Pyramimonas_sp.AAC.1